MVKRTSRKRFICVGAFLMLVRNWRVMLPLYGILVVLWFAVMGVDKISMTISGVAVFLVGWLTTIFLVRHIMAGQKVGVRDALYNAMAPTLSLLVVMAVAVVQCLPILAVLVAGSAAVETNFFAVSGQAVGFVIFAGAMLAITWVLLPHTVMAMVAVTAPGLYPGKALSETRKLLRGKTWQWWLATLVMVVVILVAGAVIYVPMAILLWNAVAPNWVLELMFSMVGCFALMYEAVYYYIYYRRLLDE
ncbi:hypothetical protein IJJ37_00675 [Candidatus Saccharibacteria bacterium]|nr:hypothetical protein [Candidatus Saccharibacteria bacterium]